MNFSKIIFALGLIASLGACTRIETGQAGIIRGWDKQIESTEASPGDLKQLLTQDVIVAQTKDIEVTATDLRPLAADNSTLDDFDVSAVYTINPQLAAELYVDKSQGFHAYNDQGELFLMYNYVQQVMKNAALKATRKYESLALNDNREAMEAYILEDMNTTLNNEKGLEGAVTVSQVLIRNIVPNKQITQSANQFIAAQNENKKKEVEVDTAQKEARRIAALSANKEAIAYMEAQATLNISEAVKDGKVQTIIIPSNITALGKIN